ncbi:carbohydrate ABC transporter permease [Enterocloster citroniae]|uniref:carbohydrate ABC transporter permease n=1 Tax=Enterocloster citroniae TaxID=358743 RepID=UPI00349E78A0
MKRTGRREKYFYYKRQATPYILLAPILLFVSLFLLWPMINVFVMSVQEYRLLKPDERHFIGFQNFVTVFTEDKVFMKAIKNSVVWVAVSVAAQTILGFWLAYLLNQKFKGRGLYRALVLSPWAVAGVMVAIIWSLIYGETFGVLNDLLLKLGLIDQNISWFSDSTRAMTAVIIANVWRGIPFFTISYLSALAGISDDIYESARIDGARTMVTLFKITLPMIKDTIVITTLLRSIWTFNAVDLINTLTGGGPNNATMTMPLYIMQKFKLEYNYGYASALAAIASCIMMVVAFTYIKIGKLGKEEMY